MKLLTTNTRIARIVFCFIAIMLPGGQTWAEDWTFLAHSPTGDVYYHEHKIEHAGNNILHVMTQSKLNEAGKKSFSFLKSADDAAIHSNSALYVFELSAIDCLREKMRNLSTLIYDDKGTILYSSPKDLQGDWNTILSQSVAEKLKNIVCTKPVFSKETVTEHADDQKSDQTGDIPNHLEDPSQKAVRLLVSKWLDNWQSGNMQIYQSCYAPDFESRGMNLKVWVSYKTKVHRKSKNIHIRIEHLQISVDGDQATAVFTQYYRSDSLKDSGIKKLVLKKMHDKWKIFQETMKPENR